MAAETVVTRAARRHRADILATRSERVEEARKVHLENRRAPSRTPSESERDTQKQKTIDMLVSQMSEPLDPRDARMFETMQNLEDGTAWALFDRVLADGNLEGIDVLNDAKKAVLYKYKEKKEILEKNRSDEAARQLGILEIVQSAVGQSGEARPWLAVEPPRAYPIRTIFPKFSPGSDPIGALDTWLAGVNNFIRLQRVDNASDQKCVLFSSVDLNAQFRLGDRLLPDSDFVKDLTYAQYIKEVRLTFSPPEESILWKSDYRHYKQNRGTTITDYIQRKASFSS